MPRSKKPNRKAADKTAAAGLNRRTTTPKQAKAPKNVAGQGRSAQTPARATKFPGRQGGR